MTFLIYQGGGGEDDYAEDPEADDGSDSKAGGHIRTLIRALLTS